MWQACCSSSNLSVGHVFHVTSELLNDKKTGRLRKGGSRKSTKTNYNNNNNKNVVPKEPPPTNSSADECRWTKKSLQGLHEAFVVFTACLSPRRYGRPLPGGIRSTKTDFDILTIETFSTWHPPRHGHSLSSATCVLALCQYRLWTQESSRTMFIIAMDFTGVYRSLCSSARKFCLSAGCQRCVECPKRTTLSGLAGFDWEHSGESEEISPWYTRHSKFAKMKSFLVW